MEMSVAPPHREPVLEVELFDLHNSHVSITSMSTGAHVGTHVDAPRHFFPDGSTIDAYPLSHFVGPGVVLDLTRHGAVPITREDLLAAPQPIRRGDIVFIYCGYAEKFATPHYATHPYLAPDAAELMVERNVRIVGTDTVTPDIPVSLRGADFHYPIHHTLLEAGVLIVENLGPGLRRVLNERLTLGIFPLRLVGGDGAPGTAFALRDGGGSP